MSEQTVEKKARNIDDVKNEYGVMCAKAGQLQYQVFTFQKDLDLINGQIRDLNLEAAQLAGKAQQEAAKQADAGVTNV